MLNCYETADHQFIVIEDEEQAVYMMKSTGKAAFKVLKHDDILKQPMIWADTNLDSHHMNHTANLLAFKYNVIGCNIADLSTMKLGDIKR